MIQKAIIEEKLNRYEMRVRIPVYNKAKTDPTATPTEQLYIARIQTLPGCSPSYKVDDVVLVTFENDLISKPIIIGLLYREGMEIRTTDIVADTLSVNVNATLTNDTILGDVTPEEIKKLSDKYTNNVAGVLIEYALSTSAYEFNGISPWSVTVPTMDAFGNYIWQRTTITYENGSITRTISCISDTTHVYYQVEEPINPLLGDIWYNLETGQVKRYVNAGENPVECIEEFISEGPPSQTFQVSNPITVSSDYPMDVTVTLNSVSIPKTYTVSNSYITIDTYAFTLLSGDFTNLQQQSIVSVTYYTAVDWMDVTNTSLREALSATALLKLQMYNQLAAVNSQVEANYGEFGDFRQLYDQHVNISDSAITISAKAPGQVTNEDLQLLLQATALAFLVNKNVVSYMSNTSLLIPKAKILNYLLFGQNDPSDTSGSNSVFTWVARANGNMALKYMPAGTNTNVPSNI